MPEEKVYESEQDMRAHTTTVKELVDHLQMLISQGHGDSMVILSRDPEGNEFSPLPNPETIGFASWDLFYVPHAAGVGDIQSFDSFDNEKDKEKFAKEVESYAAVCLWPSF